MVKSQDGWGWFEGETAASTSGEAVAGELQELSRLAARCFRGAEGERFLDHLRAITIERVLGPDAPEPLLRHLEGQRQLVAYLTTLIERGKDGSP